MTLRPEREDASTKDSRATAARNAKSGPKGPACRRARGPEHENEVALREEADGGPLQSGQVVSERSYEKE